MVTVIWVCILWLSLAGVYGQREYRIFRSVSCFQWSPWSSIVQTGCDVSCGIGTMTQSRKRMCLLTSPLLGQPPDTCSFAQMEEDSMVCDTGIPCTGTPGPWTAWQSNGACDFCVTSTQEYTRSRTCDVPDTCGALSEDMHLACSSSLTDFFANNYCNQCAGYATRIITFGNVNGQLVFFTCMYGNFEILTCDRNPCPQGGQSPMCNIYATMDLYCALANG